MEREYKRNDREALRDLYLLVGDKESVAAFDRENMGQPDVMVTDR